jgi:hypothetical protein
VRAFTSGDILTFVETRIITRFMDALNTGKQGHRQHGMFTGNDGQPTVYIKVAQDGKHDQVTYFGAAVCTKR